MTPQKTQFSDNGMAPAREGGEGRSTGELPRLAAHSRQPIDRKRHGCVYDQPTLGHSSAMVTLNIYGHCFLDSDDRAARALDAAFSSAQTENLSDSIGNN
jgi:hypothetical protein